MCSRYILAICAAHSVTVQSVESTVILTRTLGFFPLCVSAGSSVWSSVNSADGSRQTSNRMSHPQEALHQLI